MESDVIVCAKGGVVDCFDHHGVLRWSRPLAGWPWTGRTALGFPGNVAQADESR